ncbi:MAG: hypothetical protein AUG91_03385 [Actinobacteria bacterium 13_1_20CM_4_69_9]|nr:MAG: hypothetical protein AUG91_03385 [Actinobacteria bacterium 13_1_20CM_4_69_9]
MKRLGVFALLMLAAGAAAAAAAENHVAAPSAARCGGQTWRLKTFSDLQRTRVDVTAQSTTLGAIRERRGPGRVPTRRTTRYQLHTWEVPAQITAFRLDATGSVRLVLYDDNAYINAVIPAPACLSPRTRQRASILAAWHLFVDKCGHASSEWQSLGAIFFVRGLGFWGGKTPQRGGAPNGAELHPVTGLRVVAGC